MNSVRAVSGRILASVITALVFLSALSSSAGAADSAAGAADSAAGAADSAAGAADNAAGSQGRRFLSDYVQLHHGENSAIPVIAVKTALQTSDGYMWFGGHQGLMRYNGTHTRRFTSEDGFPSSNINVLFEDSQNRLWIGTNDNGVALYENRAFTIYGIYNDLPSSLIRDIGQCSDGNIFISTSGGIAVYSDEHGLEAHPALAGAPSGSLASAGDGRMMTLSSDGGIIVFDKDRVIAKYSAGHFGDAQLNSIFTSKNDVVYIGTTSNEIYVSDLSLNTVRAIRTDPLTGHNSFFEDDEGRVWICAENGAGYIEGGMFVYADGLRVNNQITCITQDYEGSYWIGTMRSGLVQLIRSPYNDVNFLAGIDDFASNTVAARNGDVLIGTEDGLIILKDFQPVETELTNMLHGVSVKHLLVDSQNRLWISTTDRFGIIMVDNDGSMRFINISNGLPGNQPRVAIEASNGDIYVGLSNGVSVIRDGEIIRNYTQEDGIISSSILSLCEGANGHIFAGSEGGGLYMIYDDNVSNFSERDGLPTGTVYCMAPAGEGVLISTGDKVSYFNTRWIRVISELSFYDNYIFDMQVSGDDVWFLGSDGIVFANIRGIMTSDTSSVTELRRFAGITAATAPGLWSYISDDGYLYISTTLGVFGIDTKNHYVNQAAPLSTISYVYADGELVDISGGRLELGRDVQRLSIHVALLSFISDGGTTSYMLEGFDNSFITSDRNDEFLVNYTNLGGGEYTFRLYGTSVDGRQSDIVTLSIRKSYALTEMPVFYVLVAAAIIAAVVLIVGALVSGRKRSLEHQRGQYMDIASQLMKVSAEMSDLKGGKNSKHSLHVAEYSVKVGKRLGLDEDELYTLYYAALLHDIGMVSVPGYILYKDSELTEEEYDIVKTHVDIGSKLLEGIDVVGDVSVGVKYHHERVDGHGYKGVSGEDIPQMAKIICVCNALDSMLTEKPYKRALTIDEAQSELLRCAGSQFDERATAALISLIVSGEVPT